MDSLRELDDRKLKSEIGSVLESWPLYRQLIWTGARSIRLPEEIRHYCPQCTKDQIWQLLQNSTAGNDYGIQLRAYRCRNCNVQLLHFAYSWGENKADPENGTPLCRFFYKFGQFPAIEERIDLELEKALRGSDDLKFYRTALRLRNFNSGIGAMAYMRRVIENHMNEMLQILREKAEAEGTGSTANVDDLRKARFEDKLAAAERLFPTSVVPPECPNPFKPLYQLTSVAIHQLTESEAVVLFDECRVVFEYVFSQLRPELKKQSEFKANLRRLAGTAAKHRGTENRDTESPAD